MVATCSCRCDGEEHCGREASNYCDGCLALLCGACYSVVQGQSTTLVPSANEIVRDLCWACHEQEREDNDRRMVSAAAHPVPVLATA